MSLTLTYDTTLARVRVAATGLDDMDPVRIERSTNEVQWVTVRGGAERTPSGGNVSLDDYEFTPGIANYYRVVVITSETVVESDDVTPTIDRVWIKSLSRPFLNRAVVVQDYSDIERPARSGTFEVVGRSLPIGISDVRGSRRWTLDLLTETPTEARTLDLILASGDPLYIQVPPDCDVPGGYVTVGNTSARRPSRRSVRRIFSLPCTESAPPGADVVGATVTWATILATYGTWADVMAAHATWADVMELIGSPEDVIVP